MTRTLLVGLLLAARLSAQDRLDEAFRGLEGTIAVYDEAAGAYTFVDEERARRRYTPWSTFKIPNSAIALETGVVGDVDEVLAWDREAYPPEDWWPEAWLDQHDLRTALASSVVPIYRGIATRIGAERMQRHLDAFAYGNRDISSGLDAFWLNGSLQISAVEQIAFLRKLRDGELGLSPRTTELVKEILLREETATYKLSGKTGGGTLNETEALGWFVGYLERGDRVYYFALNVSGPSFDEILEPRIEIAKRVLKQLGALP